MDGDDSGNSEYLFSLLKEKKISYLVLNAGENRGVGRSFQNCLGLAEGDYIFKIDTDLTFQPGWLSTTVKALDDNPDIGAISLFDYNHYDPNDDRFKPENCHLETRDEIVVVKDFVSSIYGFRRSDLNKAVNPKLVYNITDINIPDDGMHQQFGSMAITKKDFVKNQGFGVYKSVYISGTEEAPYKTPTFNEPLIFAKGSV